MQSKNFKKGDKVKIVSCKEAYKNSGKVWTCTSDSFETKYHKFEVVMLEGIPNSFYCDFLEKV